MTVSIPVVGITITNGSSVNGETGDISLTSTGGTVTITTPTSSTINLEAGTGNVVGPSSATDNAISRFDGTTGKLIKNSTVTLSDAGVIGSATIDNTNTVTLLDTLFTLQDNVSPTKQAQFQLSSITAGATRVYTLPDQTTTLVGTGTTQTLLNKTLSTGTISSAVVINATDTLLTIQKSTDGTAGFNFSASLISPVTVRTYNLPNANGTIALTSDLSSYQPLDAALTSISGVSWVQGDLPYWSGSDTSAALAKNTTASRYISNQGTSNNPTWDQINLANGVTGDLPFANLTQISGLSVLGVTGSSTADVAGIAGTADQVLRINGAGNALAFGAVDLSKSAAVTSVLLPANGGWGNSTVLTVSSNAFDTNAALGCHFRVTLGTNPNAANAPTNPTDGQRIVYEIIQPAAGSKTVTWNSAFAFGGSGAPTLTTTANKRDLVGFAYSSSNSKWMYTGSQLNF